MSQYSIVYRIALMVERSEIKQLKALGANTQDRWNGAWGALNDVMDIGLQPARPAVWPRGSEAR